MAFDTVRYFAQIENRPVILSELPILCHWPWPSSNKQKRKNPSCFVFALRATGPNITNTLSAEKNGPFSGSLVLFLGDSFLSITGADRLGRSTGGKKQYC